MNYLEYDLEHILPEHQKAFALLFEHLDMTQVTFVGGVADYLNLRSSYDMPVNDIDLAISNESLLESLSPFMELEKHPSLYLGVSDSVYISNMLIDDCNVHLDFFTVASIYGRSITTSQLLGRAVQHCDFEDMRGFHNNQIAGLTSRATGPDYSWQRLYKHSRKAGLYNLAVYKNQKHELAL